MAEIHIEKKPSIWPWIIGLLVLGLLIWGVAEMMGGDDEEVAAVEGVEAVEAPLIADPAAGVAPAAGIPISQIVASPAAWAGKRVTGEARVTEVVSDRGFWIEDQGQRMFVLVNELPNEIKNVDAGQSLRISDAMVYAGTDAIPGNMEAQALQIAKSQAAVLAVDTRSIEILGAAPAS